MLDNALLEIAYREIQTNPFFLYGVTKLLASRILLHYTLDAVDIVKKKKKQHNNVTNFIMCSLFYFAKLLHCIYWKSSCTTFCIQNLSSKSRGNCKVQLVLVLVCRRNQHSSCSTNSHCSFSEKRF